MKSVHKSMGNCYVAADICLIINLGLVPKHGGKLRLIFNLSYPENKSVNHFTPKELTETVYPDFQAAVRLCLKAGPSSYCAKSDLKSVIYLLP